MAFLPHSGLLYLGSELIRNEIGAKILDLNVVKFKHRANGEETIIKTITDYAPDLVGIGCMFSMVFSSTYQYAELIRSHFPDLKIVIGGSHPTMYHREIIQNCDFVDYVIRGEGEVSLLKLVNHFQGGLPIEEVPSLSFRKNGAIIVNPKVEVITELDKLPPMDFTLLNIDDYRHPNITKTWWNPRQLQFDASFPIFSSRGCPLNCNFCSNYLLMGKKWRSESAEKVVDRLEFLYKTYGICHFSFMDDNMTMNKTRLLKICEDILKRNMVIQWETPNGISLKNLDEDMLDAMCAAGLVRTSLAIESGSEYIRNKVMGKGLKTEQIYKVADLTKKYDSLYVQSFFIIGMPEETKTTLQDTYDLIDRINVDYPRVMHIVPFPGTAVFEQARRDNLLVDSIDVDSMWKKKLFFRKKATESDFFIKPYNMTIEELVEFKEKFNDLISKKMKKRHQERIKKLTFIRPDYSPL